MPKFIAVIEGNPEIIEAEDKAKADSMAYEIWLDQAEAHYYTEEATKENLANWGLDDDEPEDVA